MSYEDSTAVLKQWHKTDLYPIEFLHHCGFFLNNVILSHIHICSYVNTQLYIITLLPHISSS